MRSLYKSTGTKKRVWTAIVLLLLAAVVVIALELAGVINIFKPAAITIPTTSDKKSSSQGKKSDDSTSPSSESSKVAGSSGGVTSSAKLMQPYGDLVSNHKPGQNGSGTKMQSVCNTTPGANCYIEFSKSGSTYKLPVQKVGQDGSTLWTWDAKILSPGSWQIKAVATLGDQNETVTDNMRLEIR